MIDFPKLLLPEYLKLLEKRGVPAKSFAECIKWCRYFLDYCHKYPAAISQAERLPLFIEKLKGKRQSELQCRQAAYTVSAFFALQKEEPSAQHSTETADIKPPISKESSMELNTVPRRYGSPLIVIQSGLKPVVQLLQGVLLSTSSSPVSRAAVT